MTVETLTSLNTAGHVVKRARPLLGTRVEIRARGTSTARVLAAIEHAFEIVAHVHARMSYHDPASDVSRLNRAGAAIVDVDPDTWAVLDAARDLSAASGGVFDVTVAPALADHGFLPRHAGQAAPASWNDVVLLPGRRVQTRRPLNIDLGGIAKGYAVDCALQHLRDTGMDAACVNAGGDLRLFGDAPETIHVRHPLDATRLLPLCALSEGAVATSAPYFSARRAGGRIVSALFDGVTRAPCAGTHSVSVVADDCVTADALTKVVYADAEHAPSVLARYGAHAVVIESDAAGACRVRQSEGARWRDVAFDTEAAA